MTRQSEVAGLAVGAEPVGSARVLIVAAHQMVRCGLREMLREFAAVEVVGQALDIEECVELLDRLHPDVVLLDINLGSEGGFDACAKIFCRQPHTKVVFLSAYEGEMHVVDSMRAGASGHVLKTIDAEPLVDAIVRVHEGETVFDPSLIAPLPMSRLRRRTSHDWPGATRGLSRRESEVLQLMATGSDNRHIARTLFISEETVKSHVKAVLRKLGARDRAHGVVIALRGRVVR